MSKTMIDAIAAHRAAWQAYQDAPADLTEKEYWRHADEDCQTSFELARTIPADASDFAALKLHLDWWVVEEAQRREDDPTLFALHAAIEFARAPGVELASRVKDWFTPHGGAIDTPENLEHQGLEADAEILRQALVLSP